MSTAKMQKLEFGVRATIEYIEAFKPISKVFWLFKKLHSIAIISKPC